MAKNKIKLTSKFLRSAGLDEGLMEESTDMTLKRMSIPIGDVDVDVFEGNNGSLSGTISDLTIDSDGDVMMPTAFDLERFRLNPVALFNHDLDYPIGYIDDLRTKPESVWANLKFSETDDAQKIYQLAKDKVLRTFSVGFITTDALKRNDIGFLDAVDALIKAFPRRFNEDNVQSIDRIVLKCVLVEISITTVPSNLNAVFSEIKSFRAELSDKKGIETPIEEKKVEEIIPTPEVPPVEKKEIKPVENKIMIRKVGHIEQSIKKVSTLALEKQNEMSKLYIQNWGV